MDVYLLSQQTASLKYMQFLIHTSQGRGVWLGVSKGRAYRHGYPILDSSPEWCAHVCKISKCHLKSAVNITLQKLCSVICVCPFIGNSVQLQCGSIEFSHPLLKRNVLERVKILLTPPCSPPTILNRFLWNFVSGIYIKFRN